MSGLGAEPGVQALELGAQSSALGGRGSTAPSAELTGSEPGAQEPGRCSSKPRPWTPHARKVELKASNLELKGSEPGASEPGRCGSKLGPWTSQAWNMERRASNLELKGSKPRAQELGGCSSKAGTWTSCARKTELKASSPDGQIPACRLESGSGCSKARARPPRRPQVRPTPSVVDLPHGVPNHCTLCAAPAVPYGTGQR